jgi:hypothetical protein
VTAASAARQTLGISSDAAERVIRGVNALAADAPLTELIAALAP